MTAPVRTDEGEGIEGAAPICSLALAEIGRRVLLIDGDLRKPRLHEISSVPNERGLSDPLAGTKSPEGSEGIVVEAGYRNLYLLPAGSAPSSISSLLCSLRTLELLKGMRQEFDMVIIDMPQVAPLVRHQADGLLHDRRLPILED